MPSINEFLDIAAPAIEQARRDAAREATVTAMRSLARYGDRVGWNPVMVERYVNANVALLEATDD